MNRGILSLILASAASLLPVAGAGGAAAAQDTTAMSMMDAANKGDTPLPKDPKALRRVHGYVRCVAAYIAPDLLSELPASNEDLRRLSGTARFSSCGDLPKFPRLAMRGIVSEYLFEHGFETDGKPKGKPAKVFEIPAPAALEKLAPQTRASVVFIDIGTCVGKSNRAGVANLLATQVATPEERTAFAALMPSIAACVPNGVDLRMHRLLLRGYLAEGAYRAAALVSNEAS